MNKKRTLEKRILSVLMTVVMAGSAMPLPVFAEENTTDLKVSELTKEENNDMLYGYYYHANTDKRTFNQNDSIEFDGMDHSSDTASAKVYMEGKWFDIVNKDSGYKAILPEGEWLISDLSESSTSGEIRFVHRYVEPKIYMVKNFSNTVELAVGEADSNGMALASVLDSCDDEFTDFYSGLDVRVRKTVDKLENGSFRISITGRDGTDHTGDFEYYDSAVCNVFWQQGKWINAYDTCLGAIPDKEVNIHIRLKYDLLHVKAGTADNIGGSISPADAYYPVDDDYPGTSPETAEYTVTPDEGYEIEKIEATDAYGNPAEVTLNENTGKYEIRPSDLRKENTERSTAGIKAYFRQKHNDTHCLCGGKAYDGHDTHTELEWQPWTSTDSLPATAGNYYLKNNVILSAGTVTLPDGMNICLNGNSITGTDSGDTMIDVEGTTGITDCGTEGSIKNIVLSGDKDKLTLYGGVTAQWKDIEKPTGEITMGETRWNSFLDTITFGRYLNETQTVTITATDNSSKPVRIEYLLANAKMTEEELAAAAFTEYDGTISIDQDNKYVIYARLTDEAGNVTYLCSDGFIIDTTAPVIEGYENGQRAHVCSAKALKILDENFESATITHSAYTYQTWEKTFHLMSNYSDQWHTVEVHDKAGNTTTVYFYVHEKHSFNEETGICDHCGYQPAVLVKYTGEDNKGDHVEKIEFGDSYKEAMNKLPLHITIKTMNVTLFGDAEKPEAWYSICGGKWTINMNGHKFFVNADTIPDFRKFEISQPADVTILGEGAMNVDFLVTGGSLTVDGMCTFQKFEQEGGNVKVNSGVFKSFTLDEERSNYTTELCGGTYDEISVNTGTCADLLSKGYRFDGISYADAQQTTLKNVTVVACDHADMDETHFCADCGQAAIANVEVNGTTKVFDNFEKALSYAVENNGSTLRLFDDVNEKVAVKTGSFTLDAAGHTINAALNVGKGAELTVNNGKIAQNTVCAAGGKLLANGTDFAGTVNCTGEGVFSQCNFVGAVSGRSVMTLSSCGLGSTLSVSGNVEATASNVVGEITVNNNGNLTFFSGNCQSNIVVKSGGTMQIEQGEYDGIIQAQSGSTLTVSDGNLTNVQIQESANAVFSGGTFGQITVAGKPLMECLADGKAFEDVNLNEVIDGRVGIAGNVRVISHTHSCIWNTNTHEKLCGCGYVESTDSEAPVVSGIEDSKTYYGAVEFSVTDANDFTVTVDGNAIMPEDGKYTIAPDNAQHTIVATDVAGNTAGVTVTVRKLYTVILPSGTGYTVTGADTAGHGTDYEFKVKIADGYSKTENYKVLVNDMEIDGTTGDETGDTFVVAGVNGNMTITVEGVADITPPEAEIEIGTNKFNSFLNAITFKYFFKKTQNVTVTASDNGSGLSRVEYLLSETAFTDKEAITGDWTELTLTEGRAGFDIEADQKAYVYLRVTDASGNVKVINSEGVVVYTDSEAVTEAVSFTRRDDSDVSFDVRLNGNTVAALYNGDTLMDSDDYTVSESGTITLKNDYISNLAAGEYTIHVAYNPRGEEYRIGDEPAMTSVKLTVEKRTAEIVLAVRTGKTYDGDPIDSNRIDCSLRTDGTKMWEYKPAGEDDSAYSSTPSKNVGEYTVRLKTSETDDFKAGMATTTVEIVPKEVTITGVTVADKVYDGTTDAEITSSGTILGLVKNDSVEVVTGKGDFADKNVGTEKSVTFSGFALTGDDAANYVLAAQPADTTANISAKELTIKDLGVKDKQYDGRNTAEIEGSPALVGVVEGDVLELVNGIPTFDSVTTGRQIPVSFTRFTLAGDSITVGNYTLVQPKGITADIVEYTATGDEYSVNSNDWINTDFIITAEQGYQLSLTDTADGEWSDTLTASDETDHGKLIFYVKNMATGAISVKVTENYKIDKTKPTGEVRLNERTAFQESVNKITFDRFFKEDVHVKLTAKDAASGVKSVRYYKSEKVLTDDEVREITDWTDNSDFDIKVKDRDKFIIYVRIEDNAGNVTYIGSDGVTFDTTAPEIAGVDNGKTYYVTKKVMIDDENFESVTLNSESVENGFSLTGDTETAYVIRAVDKAGNVTESTVHMKPISSVTDTISDITVDNVKAGDADTVSAVEGQIFEIMETFDDSESTEDEWNKLTDAAERCKALTDCISAAKSAAEADEITAVDGITKENVKPEDRDILEKAEKALENALRDFDGNYTEEEKRDLEGKLETVKAALAAIEKAEKEAKETNKNSKLPSEKEAGSSRKGKADSSTIGKAGSVRTGDTGNLTLWIALLFISGGIAAGTVAAGKKKKYSAK